MFLIVGLGNPGREYENNRHNIGFIVADLVHAQHNFGAKKLKLQSEVSEGIIAGQKVIIQKPLTFMNCSGSAVAKLVNFLKIPLENIIVIHDDLDLALGRVKVKTGGSNGGHNGLKDIDAHIGNAYGRIRIGIGHPGNKDMVADYVLSNFSKDERSIMNTAIDTVLLKIIDLISNPTAN